MKNPLDSLRREMKSKKIDACIIPTSDPHLSEYTAEFYCFRQFLSPFSGSAGSLVITMEESGLWTDGRYYIQAEKELLGCETVLFKASEKSTEKIPDFLCRKLKKGARVSVSGELCSKLYIDKLAARLHKNGIELVYDIDFSYIWKKRPKKPCGKVFVLSEKYTGESAESKLKRIRAQMKKSALTHYALAKTDCIMWLLNLRGSDVLYTPVALCYMLISKEDAFLYIDTEKTDDNVKAYMKKIKVTLKNYNEIYSDIASLGDMSMLGADYSQTNCLLVNSVKCAHKNISDIVMNMKCIKNNVEIENIKKAYIKENTALVKSFYKIFNLCGTISECDVSDIIEEYRRQHDDYMYPSFTTIAAFGSNAAMMHYSPQRGIDCIIKKDGMLLIDTGAQFPFGTTDTTRTLIFGNISEEQRENYTLVLKGNIDIAMAVFPEGTRASSIDCLARAPLWQKMLDYRCSSGHGVGYCLCVHEDPPRLSQSSDAPLKEGMTVTDEPGVYVDDIYGIRIENHLHVIKKGESEYGVYLGFEMLNFCPIGTAGLKPCLLTNDEKKWLNEYNEKTKSSLKPYLTLEEYAWLEEYTAGI